MSGSDAAQGDEALLDGVRQGDPESWRSFVTRYEGQVAATVIGMVGHGPDAEDIGQEVFIRFFKQAKSFRGDAQVSTYLTRSAINLSLNAIKRRQRMGRWFAGAPDESLVSNATAPDRVAEAHDLSDMVSRAIRQLRPEQRAVVVLRLVQGLSTTETAAALSVAEGTVMSRLSRAQKKLRTLLQGVIDHD